MEACAKGAAGACAIADGWPGSAGLVYCMEYLEQNMDWLEEKLQRFKGKSAHSLRTATAPDVIAFNGSYVFASLSGRALSPVRYAGPSRALHTS